MPVRPLSPELAEKARLELNEDPKNLKMGYNILKNGLPGSHTYAPEQWLATFLRGSKFSLERAKEKIDLNYSLRSTAPELYTINHRNPKFKEILNLGSGLVLPKSLNSTDPRVILVRPGVYDPAKYSITDVMSVMGTIMRIMYVEDDAFVVCGGVNVMDLKGATMAHASQASPAIMKKMAVIGQDASPTRIKGTHYLNTPTGFETLLNIGKSFLNEKNKNRLHVHNNFESLYKHVPQDVLPTEYGGQGGTFQEIIDYWQKKIEEYSDWLDEDLQYGTDETQRPGKPKTAHDMFGIDGSFRQLEFD